MPGELTTTEAAVLALLEMEGERSRYDLMKFVSQAIGYVWAPAKTQLYALLPKLAERGLASSRVTRDGARPEKRLYRITPTGSKALDAWLAAEPDSAETFFSAVRRRARTPRELSRSTSSGSGPHHRPARGVPRARTDELANG